MQTAPTTLPAWGSVLAVVAHPDDESFGLGAVLAKFVGSGSEVSVLCLTRGEASTLHGVAGDLAAIRAQELQAAAGELGISRVGTVRCLTDQRPLVDHIDVLLQHGGQASPQGSADSGEVSAAAVVREMRATEVCPVRGFPLS